jgi:NAD(P)-dependent dehydrogenase (short-subunit alcohol dehydrogenase family)
VAATAHRVLITGANRGLGFEFARQYAADGWRVIGTARNAGRAKQLASIPGVEVHALDVTDAASIERLAHALTGQAIDVLLLNAAVHLQKDCSLETLDAAKWLEELNVNVIAPVMIARRLSDNVARSGLKRIVAISSGSGSITNASRSGGHAYRTGKAALNMAMKALAADLAPCGITVVPVAPGHTRTDMGGAEAPHSAEDSVAKVRAVIANLQFQDSGSFYNRDGTRLPW